MQPDPPPSPAPALEITPIGTAVPVHPAQRPRAEALRVPPTPWPPGAGLLVVQTGYHWLALGMFIKPSLALDGYWAKVGWGQNTYVMPPGWHHLLFPKGLGGRSAEAMVQVVPGRQTVVYYATPVLNFVSGVVSPTPQRSPGLPGLITIYVWLLLMLSATVVGVGYRHRIPHEHLISVPCPQSILDRFSALMEGKRCGAPRFQTSRGRPAYPRVRCPTP